MSLYSKLATFGQRFFTRSQLYKYGFNYTPMYRRSTARIVSVSDDLMEIKIKLPISYKNRNYVNSIFGGSMFSAVDPIPMVQLINLLGDDYVVWDKSAEIRFKRPAREDLFATFLCSTTELDEIKKTISTNSEMELKKMTHLTDKDGKIVFCEIVKTVYIADKTFFKTKKAKRNQK